MLDIKTYFIQTFTLVYMQKMGSPSRTAEIPVIDLNAPDAASALLGAAATFGFVFVKHRGLDIRPADVDSMFKLVGLSIPEHIHSTDTLVKSKDLFASDAEIKAKCIINSSASGKNRGWLPMHGETLDPEKQKVRSCSWVDDSLHSLTSL